MSEKFINALRQQASLASANRIFVTTGIITGYDPVNYLVTVQTDVATDDYPASQTGWIPLSALWVGNSWGLFAPPNLGDVCSIFYQDGDSQVPFASLRFFGDNARPLSVPSGEFWLVHQSGTYLKMTNDGKLSLHGNVEIDIDSPSVKLGDLAGDLQKLINAKFEDTFNTHTHGGGAPPDLPMPADNITEHTEAT